MGATSPERRTSHAMLAAVSRMCRSPAGTFALIFLLAFVIRAALLVSWADSRRHFYRLGSGIEDRVALSLVQTGRFADPYLIPSGPTAHPPPLWPGVLALIYYVFGMTPTAGYVRGLVAVGSYSTLFAMLPWFGRRLGLGTRSGVLAGVAGALIPRQGMDEIIGWGVTAHAAMALGLLTVAFLHRWTKGRRSAGGSLLLGMGCGAAFHVSPPLLLVVLGNLIFEVWWTRDRRRWYLATWVVVGAIVACAPWTWRNYAAFHEFLFIRGNLGLELRIANQPGADADGDVTFARKGTARHPSENLEEARLVRDLGEAEYMRRARNEAVGWMRAHPAEFLRLTLMRVVHFWCGPLRLPWLAALITTVTVLAFLSLRRLLPALPAPGRAALLIPLATFPLVYYFVSYLPHYPAPLAWLLLLLAAHEVQSWIFRGNGDRIWPPITRSRSSARSQTATSGAPKDSSHNTPSSSDRKGRSSMPAAEVTAKDRERFDRARARGEARAQDPSAIVEARYDAARDAIDLGFRSGGVMTIPRQVVPGLDGVPPSALETISISPAGDALSWPSLDVDVYVPGLVERAFGTRLFARATGQRGGLRRSKAKAAAARANGAKGWRPRKRVTA